MNCSPSLAKLLCGSLLLCSALATGCVVTTSSSSDNRPGRLRVNWVINGNQFNCAFLGDGPEITRGPDLRGARIYIQVDDARSEPYWQDCRSWDATTIELVPGNHRFRAYVGLADGTPITTTTNWISFYQPPASERWEQVNFNGVIPGVATSVCYDRPVPDPYAVQTPASGNCVGFANPG